MRVVTEKRSAPSLLMRLLTFVRACVLVLDHSQLIDLAELLKDGLKVLFFQIAWDLPDEEFDGVGLLHWVDVWSQRRDERAESEQEREDGGVDGVCGGGV